MLDLGNECITRPRAEGVKASATRQSDSLRQIDRQASALFNLQSLVSRFVPHVALIIGGGTPQFSPRQLVGRGDILDT